MSPPIRPRRSSIATSTTARSRTSRSRAAPPTARTATRKPAWALAVGDYNADGRLDLLKTHFADDMPALYRNLGKGLFEDVATAAGLAVENRFVQWGTGLPDLDNDGRADLFYVTGSVYPEIERVLPALSRIASPRLVFRNQGGGRFDERHRRQRRRAASPHSSRGAAFGDIDNDGDLDVLVMNMNEPPSLLRNNLRAATAGSSSRWRARVEPLRDRRARGRHGRRPTAGPDGAEPVELLLARRPPAALRPRRIAYGRRDRDHLAGGGRCTLERSCIARSRSRGDRRSGPPRLWQRTQPRHRRLSDSSCEPIMQPSRLNSASEISAQSIGASMRAFGDEELVTTRWRLWFRPSGRTGRLS